MKQKQPLITRILHWSMALLVMILFLTGWYMVDLDYYSSWYTTLPDLHVLGGLLVLFLWCIQIFRLMLPKKPLPQLSRSRLESLLAPLVKGLMMLLVLIIAVCGYLFSTAGGQGKDLFGWLFMPSISHFNASQIDTMGWLHENLSYVLMALVLLHTLGALKHHFIDRDNTLKRML